MSTEALSRLNVVIQLPNARQSENAMAYDNAVSAVGKICQFHRDSIDSSQVDYNSYFGFAIVPIHVVGFDDSQVTLFWFY